MTLREVVVRRKRAGVLISAVVVVVAAGGATVIKGWGDPDTSAPVIRITSPASDQGLYGSATLSATCKDNVGCTSVAFKIDGDPVGTATAAPFEVTVDTADYTNGPITVTAVAQDAAANTASSLAKTGTVANGEARLFIAADGDDNGVNCRRYSSYSAFPADHTTVCQSFVQAHKLARAGDIILVADGTYPDQKVCGGPTFFNPEQACQGDPNEGVLARTAPAPVTFLGVTEHGATVGGISFGQNNGGLSPIYITVDGIDVNGQTFILVPQDPGHYVFKNMHMYDITNQAVPANGLLVLNATKNVTLQNDEIGPGCCDFDGIQTNQVVNFLLEDSRIHDLYDACRYVPSGVTDAYGACSGLGFGDIDQSAGHLDGAINDTDTTVVTDTLPPFDTGYGHAFNIQIGSEIISVTGGFGTKTWTVGSRGLFGTTPASHANGAPILFSSAGYDHVDGIHAWGGDGFHILRNKWWGIGANGDPVGQTIFMEEDPVGSCNLFFDNILIENNSIIEGDTNNNAVSGGISGGGAACTPGIKNLYILYNTVTSTRTDFSGGNIAFCCVSVDTNVVIVGNIVRVMAGFFQTPNCPYQAKLEPPESDPVHRGSTQMFPLYSHNLVGDGVCGPTDVHATATFTNMDPLDPDLSLVNNGQPAIGGGENTYCPATDIDGNPRPTDRPCDMGAYQK